MLKRLNLMSQVINVSVNSVPPFCDLFPTSDGSPTSYLPSYSVELNLLQLLENRFNFRANLLYAHQVWGTKLINESSWSGMFGMVENGSSTFALCVISQSFARAQSFAFTEILFFNEITFVSPPPNEKGTRLSLILAPFSVLIWALIVLSTVLIIALLTFTGSNTLDLVVVFLKITLKQSLTFTSSTKSQVGVQFLVGLWIVSTLILSTFYTSIYFSILTVPQTTKPIDSIEDLIEVANSDSFQVILTKNSLLHQQIMTSNKDDCLFYAIGQHINRTKSRIETIMQNVHLFERVAVYITTPMISTRFLTAKNVVMHIAQDRIAADYLSILLRKECFLKKWFDPIILALREGGIFNYWLCRTVERKYPVYRTKSGIVLRQYLARKNDESLNIVNYDTQDYHQLKLHEMRSIFIIGFFGLVGALLIYFIEITWVQFIKKFSN